MLLPSIPLTYYPVEPHSVEGKLGTVWPVSSPFLAGDQNWEQTSDPSSTLPPPSFLASPLAIQLSPTNRNKPLEIKLGMKTGGRFPRSRRILRPLLRRRRLGICIRPEDDEPLVGKSTMSTNSESESESESGLTLHINPQSHPDKKMSKR